MDSYQAADHLIQHGLNAICGFFIFCLLTEGILWIFKIRNHRLRACFRLLPPIRLALEPLFWLIPSSATLLNASIFSCSHPVQHFLFRMLSEETQHALSVHGISTVMGSFLLMVPSPLICIGVFLAASISLYRIVSLSIQYKTSFSEVKGLILRATFNARPLFNQKLLQILNVQSTKIVISNEIKVPLASRGNHIIIPKKLSEEFSQNEFESVISHELEHHLWQDTLVRMMYHMVAAIYWWIPMRKWYHKIEYEQELASDASIYKYAIQGLDLATALKKTVRSNHSNHYKCAAFAKAATMSRGQLLIIRIQTVLHPSSERSQSKISATLGGIIMISLSLILRFVIC